VFTRNLWQKEQSLMVETHDVEMAVRQVLPAVNLDPADFKLDRGFVARAQRSNRYLGTTLNDIHHQFVFIGLRAATDPSEAVDSLASDALESLPESVRAVCESLVVAWVDASDQVFAAALSVSSSGRVGKLCASSWSPPDAWPEPMIDLSKSEDEMVEDAITRLESIIRNRRENGGATFAADIERAFRIIDIALARYGGEGQSTSARPSAAASDESWSAWLNRFNRSVRDEWKRVHREARKGQFSAVKPSANGPLTGIRVFLSYARPDATTLAWPTYEALSSYGAEVWFDQERSPDENQLDTGFAETIGGCDAYIMCASDEFIERTGYATQEFAWAVQQRGGGGKTKHFLVVAPSGAVLPTAVAGWPMVEFTDRDPDEFARNLLAQLQRAADVLPPALPLARPVTLRATVAPLPWQADLVSERHRAEHVLLFDEIDLETVHRLFSKNTEDDRHSMETQRRLLDVGAGLDWAGTFEDVDRWPSDPFIRDLRWRLAGVRAVVGTRSPLNGDRDWRTGVAPDVEYLATHPSPIANWPVVQGWDDSARRFALRYHAGLLRVLSELLRRGLDGGILHVPSRTIDKWNDELVARRRECADAILDLRLDARLTWRKDPPEWDALFRFWRKFILTAHSAWGEVPEAVLQLLTGNVIDIAAVAAETGWYASRYKGVAVQSFGLRSGLSSQPTIEVYASGPEAFDTPGAVHNSVRLGVVAQRDGGNILRLSWNGIPCTDIKGSRTMPAPDQLDRVMSFLRS
jgi:hypothetical protein